MNLSSKAMHKYSGTRIEKAGKELRDIRVLSAEQFDETMNVVSYWRQVHDFPLHEAMKTLQRVSIKYDKKALFAKRLKRVVSIFTKLIRFKTMSLYKMQDIGGCRAVITDKKKLRAIFRELKKLPNFQINNGSVKFNDYILAPKDDGYRGIHIIGKFLDVTDKQRLIEIQLRTPIQHYWATAVEIVDLFTKQSLKTNQGEKDWKEFFSSAGEQLALMEDIQFFTTLKKEVILEKFYKLHKGIYKSGLDGQESDVYKRFRRCSKLIRKLEVIELLDSFAQSLNHVSDFHDNEKNGFVLISIDLNARKVNTTIFKKEESKEAEEAYTQAEKKAGSSKRYIVAMVATPNITELNSAYPNYFADSTEFLHLISIVEATYEIVRQDLIARGIAP